MVSIKIAYKHGIFFVALQTFTSDPISCTAPRTQKIFKQSTLVCKLAVGSESYSQFFVKLEDSSMS